MPAPAPQLLLASSSIYRRELLARLQLPFTCQSPDIDETPLSNETPRALVGFRPSSSIGWSNYWQTFTCRHRI